MEEAQTRSASFGTGAVPAHDRSETARACRAMAADQGAAQYPFPVDAQLSAQGEKPLHAILRKLSRPQWP